MTAWHQRFVVAGLILILAGFVFGLSFGVSVNHEARLVAHDAYESVFERIAEQGGDAKWRDLEQRITAQSIAHRRAADVHGHSINIGILLIMLGFLMPVSGEARGSDNGLLLVLIVSAGVYPAGLFLQFLTLTAVGEVVSALGAIGLIGSLAALYLRFSRAVDSLNA
jgi:hypothetical protein